jgi:hypothetical protein
MNDTKVLLISTSTRLYVLCSGSNDASKAFVNKVFAERTERETLWLTSVQLRHDKCANTVVIVTTWTTDLIAF